MAPLLLASGSNGSSQLSLGHANDVHAFTKCHFHPSVEHLVPNAEILDLASSSTHALLLLRESSAGRNILFGAGTNTLGQLGPRCALWDEVKPESRFKGVDWAAPLGLDGMDWEPVKIAVCWTTSFVVYRRLQPSSGGLRAGGGGNPEEIVVACGSNDFGELGHGQDHEEGRVSITSPSTLPNIVDLGLMEGERVEMIKGGQRHVIAVITDGEGKQRMIGWGAARKGELDPCSSRGSATGSSSGGSQRAVAANRKGKGRVSTQAACLPPSRITLPISPGEQIVDIALGANHSLALMSSGKVMGWGSDAKYQITGLSDVDDVEQVAATWGGTYLLSHSSGPSEGGELWAQGANGHSQLLRSGPPSTSESRGRVDISHGMRILKLVSGSEHVLVHATDAEGKEGVWAGGWNEHGNLGLKDTVDHGALTRINWDKAIAAAGFHVGEGNLSIRGVWAGCAASWILLDV